MLPALLVLWACCRELSAGPIPLRPLPPPAETLDEASFLWDSAVTLRTAGGWRENVLLAGTNAQNTPFIGSGIEFFLLRLPVDRHRFTFLLTGDDRRYLGRLDGGPGNPAPAGETVFASHAEYRYDMTRRLGLGLVGQHFYADQVFDASSLADGLGSVQSRVHSLAAYPSLRWQVARGLRIDAGYQWQRQNFALPLDGFWANGPKGSVVWEYATNSTLEGGFRLEDRPYDSRPAANLLGIPEPGTVARFTQRHSEVAWRHQWSAAPRLRTTLRVFHLANHDEEVGFYDFDRIGVALGVRCDWKLWSFVLSGRWSHWSYERQFVSPAPEDLFRYRRRDDHEATARAQRKFGRHLTAFVEYLFEQQLSNVQLDTFASHTAQSGLEWEF